MAGNIARYAGLTFDNGKVIPYRQVDYFFEAGFEQRGPVWTNEHDKNYENLLIIKYGEEKFDKKCLMVLPGDRKEKKDTAWEVSSLKQNYTGKPGEFVLDAEVCTDAKMTNMRTNEGYSTSVIWFDKEGKQICQEKVKIDGEAREFANTRGTGRIPKGAASYRITIGFDTPNVDPGEFFAISKVRLGRVRDDGSTVSSYWMETYPALLYDDKSISWEADAPAGSSIKMQISEAEDKNGEPGNWSAFHGPDGTDKTYYVSAFKAKQPWIALKIAYFSDGKTQATLKAITLNGERDTSWYKKRFKYGPVIENLSKSPTHNRREPVVLKVTCESPILWSTFKAWVDAKEVSANFKRSRNIMTYVPSEDFADGRHKIKLELSSINGVTTESTKWMYLGDSPKVDKITLRDDGMTLVNGEPFFPIGAYSVWKREFNHFSFDEAFRGLKEGGFNFAHTYNGGEESKEFLDTAHKYGFRTWTWAWNIESDQFTKYYLNHPAVLAWYIGDDTSYNTTPAVLQDRHDAVKALDDNRITTQADGVASNQATSSYAAFVRGTDNFLPEIYPVKADTPQDREQSVPLVIKDMKVVMQNIEDGDPNHPKSVWSIIQYFDGWGSWRRFPEDNEIRAMSFASIIHGATGITWYTYGGYFDKNNNRYNHGITSTPERWKTITTIATQINKLIPVLTERTPADQPSIPVILEGPKEDALGYPAVTCLMKRHAGETYVLAVNSSIKDVKASFTLPGVSGGEVVYEGRNVKVEGGKLVDAFKPYDVHIYRLK